MPTLSLADCEPASSIDLAALSQQDEARARLARNTLKKFPHLKYLVRGASELSSSVENWRKLLREKNADPLICRMFHIDGLPSMEVWKRERTPGQLKQMALEKLEQIDLQASLLIGPPVEGSE